MKTLVDPHTIRVILCGLTIAFRMPRFRGLVLKSCHEITPIISLIKPYVDTSKHDRETLEYSTCELFTLP